MKRSAAGREIFAADRDRRSLSDPPVQSLEPEGYAGTGRQAHPLLALLGAEFRGGTPVLSTGDAAQYNANDAVQALLARGVPAAKINLGMASYGRGWSNVGAANNGLYQSGTVASGSLEPGIER